MSRARFYGAVVGLAFLGAAGCASIPRGRAAIDAVDLVGNRTVESGDVLARLATASSPQFLGLQSGAFGDLTIYDASVLQRDLARVERRYQGLGFFEAHVRVARVAYVRPDHVRIVVDVDEGAPMLNRSVRVGGLEGLPRSVGREVELAAQKALPRGSRFDEDAYRSARDAVTRALTDRGYAYATTTSEARADLASHSIDYALTVRPGIASVFGAVTFAGLDPDGSGPAKQEIDAGLLRRLVRIPLRAPFSTADIDSATQALLDLEVFTAVHVVPELSEPPDPIVPLAVEVQPAKLRTLRLGGGAELDAIKTDVHALVGWEDHNFLGGLRNFTVAFTPGIVLYPTTTNSPVAPERLLPEERLRFQLRQPGLFEARTTGFVQPELNFYPLLVRTNPDPSQPVLAYLEPKVSLGLERRFGKHFFVSLSHNVQGEVPTREPNAPPPGALPDPVVLSFPQLVTTFDFRDDRVHPHEGFYLSDDFQIAGGPFGGTATDVRIQPDVRGYIPLARHVTLALGTSFGFLFPQSTSYGDSVKNYDPSKDPLSLSDRDVETMYFRGFFAGGPASNRGYALHEVGPHGVVTFLSPTNAARLLQRNCDPHPAPGAPPFDPSKCFTPVGGFTMWQASVEVRLDVSGPLGVAAFCDAGDVSPAEFPGARSFRFDYLHLSCGAGVRYDTPVGPLRLDIGYRIQALQLLGQPSENAAANFDPTFGTPAKLFGNADNTQGVPVAFAFGIGESF